MAGTGTLQRASQNDDVRLHRILYALVAFILIEPLLLVGLIVVAVQRPGSFWFALGPYLMLTALFGGGILVHLRRAGMLSLGVLGPALICVGATIAAATAAWIAALWLAGSLAWLWTVAYVVVVAYVVTWFTRWQAANLALRCDACAHTFEAPASTWAFSVTMGDRKHIRCLDCHHHWAQIVRREGVA